MDVFIKKAKTLRECEIQQAGRVVCGKGSSRRPAKAPSKAYLEEWDRIFRSPKRNR